MLPCSEHIEGKTSFQNACSFLCGLYPFWLAASLLFLGITRQAIGQELSHRIYSTNDGLPSNTVYASLQDRYGDMWFATEHGLSRYDGFSFQNFQLKDGLPDSEVFKMFEDSKGRIWLSHSNGTLSFLENGKFRTAGNLPILKNFKVSSFFNGFLEEADGSLWFTSLDDGIFHWKKNGDVSRLKPVADFPGSLVFPGIWKDAAGEVRVCTQAGIINLSRNPSIPELPISMGINEVRYCSQRYNGDILVGLGQKILVCRPGKGVVREIGTAEGYDDFMITGIHESAEGHLWISAINGLHLFRKGRLQKEAHQVFFKGKTLSSSRFDRQGNLWLTTLNEGIILINDLESFRFAQEAGIPDVPVTSLFFHQNKLFWGNDRGAVGIIQNQRVIRLKGVPDGSRYGRGRVREFISAPDHPGEVWAASENGLIAYDQNGLQAYYGSPSKCMAFLKGNLYLGNAKSCVKIRFDKVRTVGRLLLEALQKKPADSKLVIARFNQVWRDFEYLLPSSRVYKVAVDASETIWMATHSGLYSLKNGKVRYWKELHKDLGNPFETLCLYRNQVILGSNGRGLLLLDQKEKTRWISSRNGLSSDFIRNMRVSSGGDSLWVCTSRGLNLLIPNRNGRDYRIETWTKANSSLAQDDIFDIAFQRDTTWLASGTSVVCVPSLDLMKRPPALLPEMKKVIINDKPLIGNPKILQLEPGDLLEIHLRNPDYRRSFLPSFSYRLLPDTNWKNLNGNIIRDKILSAGSYSLEIRNSADENPEAILQLAEIQAGNRFQQFNLTTGISRKNFLLFLIPVLMLIFSWYKYLAQKTRKSKDDRQEASQKQFQSIYLLLIHYNNPPDGASEAMLQLRSKLSETRWTFSITDEMALCLAYAGLLKVCDEKANVFFDTAGFPENYRHDARFLLPFLMEKLLPFQTDGQNYLFRIRMAEKKIRISLSVEKTGLLQLLPDAEREIPLKRQSFFNRILPRRMRLFP